MQEEHVSDRMMFEAAEWEIIDVTIWRACWKWLGHVARMHVPALPKIALWGWPLSSKPGSRKRLQGSWLKTVLAKTSISSRDWFRVAVSRGGQWQAAGRRFFGRKRCSKDQALRLRSWRKDSPLPMPPPKRVRRFDPVPSTPGSPSVCPVCREDLGSVVALGAHYNSLHAVTSQPVRDILLVTRPSFQCSRCSLVFATEKRLQSHACSSGDQLLQARMTGQVAASARRPQPTASQFIQLGLKFKPDKIWA